MKKIISMCLVMTLILTLVACGDSEKEYPYKLSEKETEKFIDGFSQSIESDDGSTLKPEDMEVYQINNDEQAAILTAKEDSEEFIVILDKDYNIIENAFINSEEDKNVILESGGISNISIPKYSFKYEGNIDEKLKQGLIETATGPMLEALTNANSIEIETVDQKVKVGTKAGCPCVLEAVYYYEVTAIDDQDNSIVGLFHTSTKNYSNTTPKTCIYYDGLK